MKDPNCISDMCRRDDLYVTAKWNNFEIEFSTQVKVTDVKRSLYGIVLNLAQGTVSQSFVDIT
jgi:hypothetical protein